MRRVEEAYHHFTSSIAFPMHSLQLFHQFIKLRGRISCEKKNQAQLFLKVAPGWIKSGPEGAVIFEFSAKNSDDSDIFTDTNIKEYWK